MKSAKTDRGSDVKTVTRTDSYKAALKAKREGKIVTLTAHGWKIEDR